MPNGLLSKSQAEVALELVRSYLEFADEGDRAAYKAAEGYFDLYRKAYALIVEVEKQSGGGGGKAGF